MIVCPVCQRLFPEVAGANTQVCPHCGHEHASAAGEPSARKELPSADPVGALELAWRVGRREYGWFLLMLLPVVALEIAAGLVTAAYATAAGLPADPARMTTGQQMRYLGLALPLFVGLIALRLTVSTFIAARVLDAALGGARLSRWRALLAPALGLGAVLTLTYTAGLLLFLVGFFVFLHWFLYAPAQLAAGAQGVGSAMERSRRFARDRKTIGFTALVVLVGAFVLVPYVALGAVGGPVGTYGPLLVSWIAGPLVPILAASFVALASAQPASGAAAVPAPRATTTCPRCGVLFPYTPGNGPTEVACPACGHAGRVL